jgi:hypothetical protein
MTNDKENEIKAFIVTSNEFSELGIVGVFETLEKSVKCTSQSTKYFRDLIIELLEASEHLATWYCDPYDLKPKLRWEKKPDYN